MQGIRLRQAVPPWEEAPVPSRGTDLRQLALVEVQACDVAEGEGVIWLAPQHRLERLLCLLQLAELLVRQSEPRERLWSVRLVRHRLHATHALARARFRHQAFPCNPREHARERMHDM